MQTPYRPPIRKCTPHSTPVETSRCTARLVGTHTPHHMPKSVVTVPAQLPPCSAGMETVQGKAMEGPTLLSRVPADPVGSGPIHCCRTNAPNVAAENGACYLLTGPTGQGSGVDRRCLQFRVSHWPQAYRAPSPPGTGGLVIRGLVQPGLSLAMRTERTMRGPWGASVWHPSAAGCCRHK